MDMQSQGQEKNSAHGEKTHLFKKTGETVEKPPPPRLMENVHMQGFRNPEE
jgi:hypothetical protein